MDVTARAQLALPVSCTGRAVLGRQGQGDWKTLCSAQVLLKEAEELGWTSSYKSWTDAIDK